MIKPLCHIFSHFCNLKRFPCTLFSHSNNASVKNKFYDGWGKSQLVSLPQNRWEMIQNKTVSRGTNSALSFGKKNDFFFCVYAKVSDEIKLVFVYFHFPTLSSTV